MSKEDYYYKMASPEYIKQAGKVFDEQLARQAAGEFNDNHVNHIYKLGYPGEFLLAAGFPDDKIEMLASQLRAKSVDPKHPFDILSLKGLVKSLNNPVAVFVYGAKSKAENVIVEQEYNSKKFLIGVHFNQEYGSTRISAIRGIHPRDTHEILNWIQKGRMLYVDKDKIQILLVKQRINPADVDYLDLDFVAKVVKNFENPKFSMEKVLIMDDFYDENKFHEAKDDIKKLSEMIPEQKILSGIKENINMADKNKNNSEKVFDSQEFCVSLHQENDNTDEYGTDNHRRAETDLDEDHSAGWTERLGIHAYLANGRPTLDRRWDTLVYEEGLQSEQVDRQLGSPRLAVRNESDRLIELSRKLGDYIPSTVWDSFGLRNTKPSGESIVFIDEENDRVIKFKDPFAYVSLKDDNPYTALYEHHIHNHFFGDVGYRFLGISQDPVSGGVRFAFEQPFIMSAGKPSKEEITDWFKGHGFELSNDGFWYTDGNVSFTDVEGDNCIKDIEGNLHFIDPIIKFEKEPKEVIAHYIEQERSQKRVAARSAVLERAGDPSAHAAFTDLQLSDIKNFTDSFGDGQAKVHFIELITSMKDDFKKAGIPQEWVDDTKAEYTELIEKGIRRDSESQGLKI